MKIFIAFCTLFISISLNAQLSGDVVQDGRELKKSGPFVIEGNHTGKVVFDISVNPLGVITGFKVNQQETTIKSTPTQISARKHISEWRFEPGTHFPQYHQGKIIITVVKPID